MPSNAGKVSEKKTNVVLLSIDALRCDHLGIYGYDREPDEALKPYLDHTAVFRNAYTYSMATARSFSSIFSSIWPDLCVTKHPLLESYKKAWLPQFCSSIAEKFQESGYYTAGHTCWVNYLTDKQGFGRGFTDFHGFLRQDQTKNRRDDASFLSKASIYAQYGLRYIPSFSILKLMERQFHWLRETINTLGFSYTESPGTQGRSSKMVTDYLLDCIDEHQDKPFFIWGHYLDAHTPFSPPAEFQYSKTDPKVKREITNRIFHNRDLPERLRGPLIDLYDGEIRSAFNQVRRVFDYLGSHNLLENTCVIILADHGQGFREHGYWECPDDMFYDETIHVPLLIYNSQLFHKQMSIESPISLIDLSPTLLDICSLPEERRFFGNSFFSLLEDKDTAGSDKEIWLETVGPPRRYCRIQNNEKVIYDKDSNTFPYGITPDNQYMPPEKIDKNRFLGALKNYEESKRDYLARTSDQRNPGV